MKTAIKAILIFTLCFFKLSAQHIYYRNVTPEILSQFNDSSGKIVFVNKDSAADYSHHFAYMLKFFPTMEYHRITVIFKPMERAASVKPTFRCFFQGPQKRHYKMYFSTKSNPTIDSVLLKNLTTNEQLGLIARELGYVQDLSTDGFFDLVAWHFKQIARRPRKKLERDNEIKTLELGCGYQMLALSKVEEEKLKIENWHNAHAYTRYVKHFKSEFMSPSAIQNFIQDLPVYVSHQYK